MKYLNKFTSILPPATDIDPIFKINQAEQNVIKSLDRLIKKC